MHLRYRHPNNNINQGQEADEPYCGSSQPTDYICKKEVITTLPSYPTQSCLLHLAIVTCSAFAIRAWSFGAPATIVDNEILIGQQINWLLEGKFYIGNGPPMAAMVYSLVAWMAGYKGNELILYSGQMLYIFPLEILRWWSLLLGTLLVPSTYFLARTFNAPHRVCMLASMFVGFENGMVAESRFISEQTPFLLSSCLALTAFFNAQANSPSFKSMMIGSCMLGISMATRWHGALIVIQLLVFSMVIAWKDMCNPRLSLQATVKNFTYQVVALTLVPTLVYCLVFQAYFLAVPNSGEHDLLVDSKIRYSLIGNEFGPTQRQVAFGSMVRLKHVGSNNGYLHSHEEVYESGSKQQQVTVYPYVDNNNLWTVVQVNPSNDTVDGVSFVKNNDAIKLEHLGTSRRLHSHEHKPPIHASDGYSEVSAYGDPFVDDPNDVWWIRIITDDGGYDTENNEQLETLQRFRLFHSRGCDLSSHRQPLPFNHAQQEVTCLQTAKPSVASWVIEYSFHEDLKENHPSSSYPRPSFIHKLKFMHQAIWKYDQIMFDNLSTLQATDIRRVQQTSLKQYLMQQRAKWIWHDISGKSVYIILHPFLRVSFFVIAMPFTLLFASECISKKCRWMSCSRWSSAQIAGSSVQVMCLSICGMCIHILGSSILPLHMISLSDLFIILVYGAIGVSCTMDWVGIQTVILLSKIMNQMSVRFNFDTYYHPKINTHSKIYTWLPLLAAVAYVMQFSKWYRPTDGTALWTADECFSLNIQDLVCNQYPSSASNLANEAGSSPIMKHIRLAFPGEEKMFTFLPGEEVKAQGRFALERSKAFEEASLKYGKARYIRPKQTPSPLMSDLLKRKGEVMEETKRRHEAQQQAYQEEQARQQAEEQAQEHIQEHIQEEIQEHSQEQAKVHAQ